MHAPEPAQVRVVQRLHAERHAVDAGGAIAPEPGRLDAGRIGLQCDLGALADLPRRRDCVEDGARRRGRHERGRAAAEENARHPPPPRERRHMGDLALERRQEARLVDGPVPDVAVEVAIGALRQAERPVHVDAEARIAGGVVDHGAHVSGRRRNDKARGAVESATTGPVSRSGHRNRRASQSRTTKLPRRPPRQARDNAGRRAPRDAVGFLPSRGHNSGLPNREPARAAFRKPPRTTGSRSAS
jgi:hypothetical protein